MPPNEVGCPQESACLPKPKDNDGNDCPGICPIFCNVDESFCLGQVDDKGCRDVDTCVKRGEDENGDLCPGTCPVQCEFDEILCNGPTLENGCTMADVCHTKAKNDNGEYCPINSASHSCPIVCKESETLCPAHESNLLAFR